MSRLALRLFVLRRLIQLALKPATWRRRPPTSPRRILVLHHLLLGDTLMLTPLLAKLAERYPDAERYLACPQGFTGLYAGHPFGIRALAWNPRSPDGLHALRKAAPFDLVIVPAENRFSPLARALGAGWVVAFDDDVPRWKNWLVDDRRPFPQSAATFGDFCATLINGPAPRAFTPQDWPVPACAAFEPPAKRYAVLHLGASTPLKYWPAQRWAALAEWLARQGLEPIWSAGARESALVSQADPEGKFRNLAGGLDLPGLAQLFAQAQLVVCPDTGVAHLARIVGTPTVALFGPGSSTICGAGDYWRDSPFVALSAEIDCRNQDVTFRRHAKWIRRCARSYGADSNQCLRPRCMEALLPEVVRDTCARLLHLKEV